MLCTLLLIATPSISAQQYALANDAIKNELKMQLENIGSSSDAQKYFGFLLESDFFSKEDALLVNSDDTTTESPLISNLLISLILAFFGTMFGIIFGPFVALIIKIVTWPTVKLAELISSLFSEELCEVTTI